MRPIALTMGEPAGVGAEIAVAAWAALRTGAAPFFMIADPAWLEAAAAPAGVPCAVIQSPEQASPAFDSALPVLPIALAAPSVPGELDHRNAPSVLRSLDIAVDLTRSGAASALVTNPIHKHALYRGAGFAYPGHTEYLAAKAGAPRTVMLMVADQLKVAPATIHIPLADVPGALSAALIEETVRILAAGLRDDFGASAPRIAVAGLNPHAGEGGSIGREEIELIAPALDRLAAEGIDVVGPLSADTLFHAAARRRYDAAVCMYHDQALIPVKTLAFDTGVNMTLGLPFVRTSPDHGPALDIAGQDAADPTSLIHALRLAGEVAARRAER